MRKILCLFALMLSLAARAKSPVDLLQFLDQPQVLHPIIQFRARGIEDGSYSGHILIVFGWKNPDGTTVLDAAGGFYPVPGTTTLETIKNFFGKGVVEYKPEDLKADHVFEVEVTNYENILARSILSNWSSGTDYNLLQRNCITLAGDIAKAIGLKVDDSISIQELKAANYSWPVQFLDILAKNNERNTPLTYASQEVKQLQFVAKLTGDEAWRWFPKGPAAWHPPPKSPPGAAHGPYGQGGPDDPFYQDLSGGRGSNSGVTVPGTSRSPGAIGSAIGSPNQLSTICDGTLCY
jgi:hypothetical protein